MESLYLLIPIALIIVALAIKLLFWAINSGQYDDLNTEGHRILFDEPVEKRNIEKKDMEKDSEESVTTEKKISHDAPSNNQEVP
jgi:cbb3-type cytochrome oxidase maturation protein